MREPRRMLVEAETSKLARSLLAAGRARREPHGARERVWSAVAVGLAGGAATAAAAGGAGAGVQAVAPALAKMKLLIVGAILVGAAGAGVVAMNREAPAPAPVAAVRIANTQPPATNDPEPESIPEAQPAPVSEPVASAQRPPAARAAGIADKRSSRARENMDPQPVVKPTPVEHAEAPAAGISKLREEAALLQEARVALGHGDTNIARTKLAYARTRFPNSQLGEERDALDVRVANASGDRGRAASLARAFVEHYPDSPLRAGVESIGAQAR